MQHAVNKEEIVKHVLEGLGQAATVPYAPALWGSAEGMIDAPKYDPMKAKELLAEAGWKNTDNEGFLVNSSGKRLSFTLHTPEGRYLRDKEIAQTIQAQLMDIGVDAKLRTWEWAGYLAELKNQELGMFLVSFGVSTGTVDGGLSGNAYSEGGYNYHGYSNPRVDELFFKARGEIDQDKLINMYYEAQKIVMDDAQVIPINHMAVMAAINYKRVQDFQIQASSRIRLLDVKSLGSVKFFV